MKLRLSTEPSAWRALGDLSPRTRHYYGTGPMVTPSFVRFEPHWHRLVGQRGSGYTDQLHQACWGRSMRCP